jgi:hypothetical protein
MFIGERRIEKCWIRSRIPGHLIVDRVSRKPQKKAPGGEPLYRVPQPMAVFALALVQRQHVKAGGSCELPSAVLSPGALLDQANRTNRTLGYSREPPVLTRFGQDRR